ncbi:SETDB2-PHF11 protein [Octodon degus]|uniref:Histone-lysine N-methyltransferase SETDB2 n=1 Tax=Octodon degus TaxID=10160 RepID=A0A6P6EL43_OCTDE|nr:SETDB2-PHF11 protein [Octodon degus]
MGEKNGDARSFWMELEDDGKVDFIFEKVQNVLQSLKQKIKDGSATNKEYIQAMILVNDATISKNSTLKKHHICVTQNEQENKTSTFPSTSSEDSFPKDCTFLTLETKKILSLANKVVECRGKKSPMNLSCRSHDCSGACLMKMPSTIKAENPLQLPIICHFQRRHAKTNTQSSALHVSYKAPCGRSLRNMEEVFRYLLETNCNFLFTDNFSFNTFVQLTRNYQKQEEIVSDVDISNGVELVPVSFCNEINSRRLPSFKYRKTMWPPAYYLNNFSNMFTDSCDCSEGCIDMEMNYENISRIQNHSVIRSSKFKTAIFQQNGKKMELISLDSDTSRENNGFLNCKARRKQKESSSNQVGDSEDNQLHESDVIDITKCREETPPGDRCHQASTFDSENIEVQIKMPQEEKSPAHQKQQAFDDKLLSETKNTSSTSPVKSSNEIMFLLDATKEGNVGRFLNHSCCPNLLVQNVFIETHDRNFPLVAFFTNRYVKARTELTWDYDYKVGTVPNKEILCQCGANKCRKKILSQGACGWRGRREPTDPDLRGRTEGGDLRKESETAAPAFPGAPLCTARPPPLVAMAQPSPSSSPVPPEPAQDPGDPAAHPVRAPLPLPTGVFQVAERLEKRICALCRKGTDYSVLYFARSENIAAHENCLLYSSALVECEDQDPLNNDRNFDVESVKKEIQRGRKLKCTHCRQKGATVGCDLKYCAKNYHFFCAMEDKAFLQADGLRGIYKLLCRQHAPKSNITQSADCSKVQRKRGRKKRLPAGIPVPPNETVLVDRSETQVKDESGSHTDTIMKVSFLKKCKKAGLLNDLFENLLDELHLIQQKLLDDTTSESAYEKIGTSLFDCGLFEDTLAKFNAAIENKIHESKERLKQLEQEIELLQDLKQTLSCCQDNGDLTSTTTSVSSLSS